MSSNLTASAKHQNPARGFLFGGGSEPTAWLAGEIRRVCPAGQTAARRMWANLIWLSNPSARMSRRLVNPSAKHQNPARGFLFGGGSEPMLHSRARFALQVNAVPPCGALFSTTRIISELQDLSNDSAPSRCSVAASAMTSTPSRLNSSSITSA